MVIHGVILDFSLYNSKNIQMRERYFEELKKMRSIKQDMQENKTEKENTEYLCKRIKKMFDSVFGSGTGVKVCGEEDDLLVCMDAYERLVNEQMRQQKRYKGIMRNLGNLSKGTPKK